MKKASSTSATRNSARKNDTVNMDLFVLRHGEAGNRMVGMEKDFERALTVMGRKEIAKISKSIRSFGIELDKIATSPLKRAVETAKIVATTFDKIDELEEWNELKPDGNHASLYKKLASLKQNPSTMLVGHEPFLSSMITEIIGNTDARIAVKKGGLAKIRISSFTPRVSGELRWLLTPKLITKMS